MKKNIYRAFDEIEQLSESVEKIDESSVYADVDIDIEKIKRGAFEMAGIKNSKKKTGRKLTIFLVAAALMAAAVGTTAAAGGSFHSVFGQMIAGEAVDGIFAGGNVKTESDTLNINFKGVTGDDRQACAMMTITKKDGTAFTNDTENAFIGRYAYDDAKISCTKPFWQRILHGTDEHDSGHGDVLYDLADAKTIDAYIWYKDDVCSLIGETLSVANTKIYLYHLEKELSTWDEFINSLGMEDDNHEELKENQIRTICDGKMVTLTLKDNETITCYKDKQVLATYEEIDLQYDLSVQLNYRKQEKVLDELADKIILFNDVPKMIRKVAVQPYTMQIELYEEGNFTVSDDVSATQKILSTYADKFNRLTITTTDGNVYDAVRLSGTFSGGYETLIYQFTDTAREKIAYINPDKILSITCDGTTFYQK